MSMTIKEKLEKEQNKLEALLEQKRELERKIQKVQENVNKYDAMIKQKTYKETDEILSANNLTLEMINEAIKSGDLTALQLIIEENKTSNKETAEVDSQELVSTVNM